MSHTENKERDSKESSSNTPGRRKTWSWPHLAELVLGKETGPCPLQENAPTPWLENRFRDHSRSDFESFLHGSTTAVGEVKRASPGTTMGELWQQVVTGRAREAL